MTNTPLYDILPTPYGGRGAFARQHIPKGTQILSCAAPYAHVIFWEFRREVCAWCFAYAFESGKSKWSLKLADSERAGGNGGVWFCSPTCRDDYIRDHEIFEGQGVEWRTEIGVTVEKVLAQHSKRKAALTVAPERLAYLETIQADDITPACLDQAWAAAQGIPEQKKGWTEELTDLEIDTARFVLDGLLRKIVEAENPQSATLDRVADGGNGYFVGAGRWADYTQLQDNELPLMRTKPRMLASHIRAYRFLRHVATALPKSSSFSATTLRVIDRLQQDLATPASTRALLSRDAGNVFGIWDMATDEGSEMLGWGAFVFASYFNHNCDPNIKKRRNKRGVEFYAIKDIAAGEEICISYADGTSVEDRIRVLKSGWFFVCRCTRCVQDLESASNRPVS